MSNELCMMSASENGGCEHEHQDLLTKRERAIVTVVDHDASCKKDPKTNRCRQWINNHWRCAVRLIIAAFIIKAIIIVVLAVLLVRKNDNEGQQNANVSKVEICLQPSNLKGIQEYYNKCSIQIPANTTRLEGQSCLNEPQDCYPCNDTCLGADAIKEEINKHIRCNNINHKIDCCVVLSVSGNGQCGNHGDLVCINSNSLPVCQCHPGWTGPFCNETDLVKALCKCDMRNQTTTDENAEPNCSSTGRPKDWQFCLHVSKNGTKCICANFKHDFFKDEKALAADCLL